MQKWRYAKEYKPIKHLNSFVQMSDERYILFYRRWISNFLNDAQ